MSAGRLVAWRKKPGDRVARGDIIAEVETEKAAIDVEVFTNGVLEQLLVKPGEKVPVGTALALIREDGAPAAIPATPAPAVAAVEPFPSPAPYMPGVKISPSAKRLAADLGVDWTALSATGPDGAITRRDVEVAATQARGERREAMGVEAAADRAARMRQTIAAAMARSKREIPHYYLSTTIDMGPAMTWLRDKNLKRAVPDRLLYGVLLLKAVALALHKVPELNATWQEGRALQHEEIHVGVAISLRQGGLIAPALHQTDRQSVDELMRRFRDLVTRARAGTLRSSELSDPTITVTSLGEQGVETAFGVIYPPQVAIVGFGKVIERPWVVDGKVMARPVVTATLSADHRVTDGHRGGLFLAAVDRLLQTPGQL
jgi:pyruvate dehydrogenase E2 component (dihydrolipoamide acetyltransferase)